ncbi:unnamed protein product [Rhizophagus irregularis]|uniref:DUF7431 domain-containing protein n=2 Tax=Rhizophagus irregularis TaxID=588596 RepID=A0A2I1EKU8_9GLOM|nr:hypothetical protein RhiirB3_471049 [Rhizophagus irregularis]CAB4494229.1 unnamed protein product [Rhizophagus irregularis]CAB5090099.1 unnamed protein product [Rhizophagus irregularis]CAB5376816.1 unnamed protein product [Rhizophagus irregularis]
MDKITVQIDNQRPVLVSLNLEDKLSKIRERLMQKVKMNDILSFAKKISYDKNNESLFARIVRGDEAEILLREIVERKNENLIFLYLSSPDYNFLKNKLKLEYGRTTSLGEINKSAFTINNFKMTEIVNGHKKSTIAINSEEDQIMKKGVNTTKIVGNSKINVHVIEYNKAIFKFEELKPTIEFIEVVNDAIKSEDLRKFKKITEEFGQFIPKEVILGGKAYFKELSYENAISKSTSKNHSSNYECFKLLGGRSLSFKEFNETYWAKSLNDFRNWDCIKIKNSISVFSPLHEDLRKKISLLIGRRILYISTEDYDYKNLEEIYELKNIPKVILKTLQNEDADCSIFATVIDDRKNVTFNCQIYWPPKKDPKLIIHCIQKKFRKYECKLKIMLMIIGYDINFNFNYPDFNFQLEVQRIDFNSSKTKFNKISLGLEGDSSYCFGIPILRKLNTSNNSLVIKHNFFSDGNGKIGTCIFSYCLEKKHYVNLPDFTFHMLIISNYNSNYTGTLPLKHNESIRNLFKILFKRKYESLNPKYVSLYSTGENNCGPIFLKQKTNKIKVKYLKNSCDEINCICKNKTFKKSINNLKYVYFDPYQDKNLMSDIIKSNDRLRYWEN